MDITITLQPKQREAYQKSLNTPVLFYGGAKGGGKSHLVRARELLRRLQHPNTKGLIIRKTYGELLANHIRPFFQEYPIVKEWFNKSEKTIYYPNGSTTEFSYLKNTDDVYTYQGREYEDITIDEITQHEEEVFKILRSSLRTANYDFSQKAITTMFLTGNPGGIGHGWVKRIFVDSEYNENENPDDFGFVQAMVYDNKALIDADPNYVQRLMDLPEDKRRAYLEGDWNVFAGQVFREFRPNIHTIRPIVPKSQHDHYLSMDWGYSEKSAFAGYAHAVLREKTADGQNFNRVITYKEWYGNQINPEGWAEKIYEEMKHKNFQRGYCDPAMFNTGQDGSVSIADRMEGSWKRLNGGKYWCKLNRANNNRVARVATVHDWLSLAPDGMPYWIITESCPNLIRTLPQLVYDDNKVDDVDTDMEDHCVSGDTKVLTESGWVEIQHLPYSKVTGYDTIVVDLVTESGRRITCTPNHKILTPDGWKLAGDLEAGSLILSLYQELPKSLEVSDSISVETTTQNSQKELKEATDSTGLFGSFIKAKFQKDGIYTIKTETDQTTNYQTSKRLDLLNTSLIIPVTQQIDKERQGEKTQSNMLQKVIANLLESNAVERLKLVGNERKIDKVYDIGTDHEFHGFIANNGFIVHNSYDSAGYFLMMVKFIRATTGAVGGVKRRKVFNPFNATGQNVGIDISKFGERQKPKQSWQTSV